MRKGIHPLMRTVTVVMRNGASFKMQSVMNHPAPYILQVDTTNNPLWTGQKEGLSLEDARIARLMKRYEGYVQTVEEEPAAAAGGKGKQQ